MKQADIQNTATLLWSFAQEPWFWFVFLVGVFVLGSLIHFVITTMQTEWAIWRMK